MPKFHPDPTWNDKALGFWEERRPNKNKNKNDNKIEQDELALKFFPQETCFT